MNRHLRLLAILVAVAVLAACKRPADEAATPAAAPAAPAPAKAPEPPAAPVAGADEATARPAIPTLRLATVDGAQYDLAAHRGNWVVVNFWATWCAPCLKEMPELSALDAMREHVEVLGLAYEDIAPADMRTFLQKQL